MIIFAKYLKLTPTPQHLRPTSYLNSKSVHLFATQVQDFAKKYFFKQSEAQDSQYATKMSIISLFNEFHDTRSGKLLKNVIKVLPPNTTCPFHYKNIQQQNCHEIYIDSPPAIE